jgi:O-antigen ligase
MLLGVALVYCALLGGSEAGVFLVPFQVINAVIGASLVAWWIVALRRGTDLTDLLVMGGLVAFLIACAAARYPRQAFDASTSTLVWAGAFGVGRRILADPRHRLLCLRLLALCGLLLGVAFLIAWGRVWIDWMRLVGGIPPLDLALPQHIYRHYYVVAMLLAALAPACAYMLRDRILRFPAAVALVLTVALSVLSGSRTVWLGFVIVGFAAAVLFNRSRRPLIALIGLTSVLIILAFASGWLSPVMARLVASGTIDYRFDIWRSAIQIWNEHLVTGIGPGAITIGLTLTDLMTHYSFGNRHADSAIIQLAAEGGLFGLAGAILASVGVAVGRQSSLPGARIALLGLILLAGFSLTNNPTDSPNLVAVIVCYAALVAPYDPLARRPSAVAPIRRAYTGTVWVAAGSVALAVAAFNVAAVNEASARSSVAAGSWSLASQQLAAATTLDPGMALYHREYGLVLMELAADPLFALRELEAATELNPADTAALRALAVQRASVGDGGGARNAARRAAEIRPLFAENWIALAVVADGSEAHAALVEALRLAPWLPGSPAWPEHLADQAAIDAALDEAAARAMTRPAPRDAIALAWLDAFTSTGPLARDTPPLRALKDVISCNLGDADRAFAGMGANWVRTTAGVVGRIMLVRLTGDPSSEDLIHIAGLWQPDLGAAARGFASAYSLLADPVSDAQLYRRLGIGSASPGLVVPRTPDALGAWMVAPREAAARIAPTSPLADCRS